MALPPGITPKTVTVGIASFFDGSLAEGTATITAPVNVVHTPSNRPIFSSQISKRFVDGETSFDLCPTDAAGLNRVDWTYKLNVVISGAITQPDPIYFVLPEAGPDLIDLDSLVTVPGSAGTPVSVQVLTAEDLPDYMADVAADEDSAFSVTQRAAFGRAPGLHSFRDFTVVADRSAMTHGSTNLSNGTDTGQMTRTRHAFLTDVRGLSLVFGNWYWSAAGFTDADGPNSITVRAALERSDGTFQPVYFNGQRDVTLAPGANVMSDPVSFDHDGPTAANPFFWVRTYVTATAGGMWPTNVDLWNLTFPGEGTERGTTTTDKTTSGTVATVNGQKGYGPYLVLGSRNPENPRSLVAVMGDSIAWGGDDDGGGTSDTTAVDYGWVSRAFKAVGQPYVKTASGADRPDMYVQWALSRRRRTLIDGVSHALVYTGVNLIRVGVSLAATKEATLSQWQQLADRGIKVYACTVGPMSNSTDSWSTTVNQTTDASDPVRAAFNDWIRTTPAPLSGYIEMADVMETARNSGIWKVNGAPGGFTADGVHPRSLMHVQMATYLQSVADVFDL